MATTHIYTFLHTLSLHVALPIHMMFSPGLSRMSRVTCSWSRQIITRRTQRRGSFRPASGVIENPGRGKSSRCNGPHPHTVGQWKAGRSEEHTSELQSLMRTSYAVFCLKKKTNITQNLRN